MRHLVTITVLFLLHLTVACVLPGDNERPPLTDPDAGVSEVRVCNLGGDFAECSIDDAPAPCGALEVEVAPLEVGRCTYTAAPACADLACEWMVECDLGGCTCVVGYPAGRLTTCTR